MKTVSNPYFFIVGVGRSGTTLLMGILNAHPQITLPPETQFVRRILVERVSETLTLAGMTALLTTDRNYPRLDISVDQVIDPFVEDQIPYSPVAIYKRILGIHAGRWGKAIVGDKSPKAIERLPVLKHLFPNTRILHIVRDPRDVFLSRKKADWSKDRHDFLQLLAYRAQFAMSRRFGQRLFEERYLEVRYEDLLSTPQDTLERICSFLSVPYSEKMLSFQSSAQRLVSEDDMQWHHNVLKPIMTNNMDKWRERLDRKQILLVEDACRDAMCQHDYQTAGFIPTISERVQVSVWHSSLVIATYLYSLYIHWQNTKALKQLSKYESVI